jgi:hypothetical protein
MSHYAEINDKNVVIRVIVAEESFIQSGIVGDPNKWVQTSYNTRENEHPYKTPFRKNYAGIGYTYDEELDAFIPPKPFPSWVLDITKCIWVPPVPKPESENYAWDEDSLSWILQEEKL